MNPAEAIHLVSTDTQLAELRADYNALAELFAAQQDLIHGLTKRVEALEAGAVTVKVDDLSERVLAYLKARPGERTTALVVAANIDSDNRTVITRLNTLVKAGQIREIKTQGKTRFFYYPED